MKFKYHFFFGILFSILLYFLFQSIIPLWGLTIIFLSSFLIDFDHYLFYVFKKRDLSLRRAYKWYVKYSHKFCSVPLDKRKKYYLGFYIFHGIEPLIVLFSLGFFVSPLFTFILIGFLFHLSTDLVSEIIFGQRIDKISVICNFWIMGKLTNFEEVDSY
jgi:hypothetical protein